MTGIQNRADSATTTLDIVNYELLKKRDHQEIQKLLQASRDRGVFFLDLRGPSTQQALSDLKEIYKAQLNFFEDLPEIDKLSFSKGESPGG
jgi:isopenicillin N synthase-like dioxygenase